jgi:hypothetical protein
LRLDADKVKAYGIPMTVASLQSLPRDKQVLQAMFRNEGWLGLFFLNNSKRLVGFILMPTRDAPTDALE